MSGGAFRVRDVGVHGPFRTVPIPEGTPDAHRLGHDALLTGADEYGVPLASFAIRDVIDARRTALIHIKAGAVGGQVHSGDGTAESGIRFAGLDAGVGVTEDVNERSRAVLCHEASHLVLDVVDRYGSRVPLRGDLIANRPSIGAREPFVIERLDGTGPVANGDVVTLRAHDDTYVSVDATAPNFLNLEGTRNGRDRQFTIDAIAPGVIASGASVGLRSARGTWVTAELGSEGVVTANRPSRRAWETFELLKRDGDLSQIHSGDRVCFKSSAGLFVSANTNGRSQKVSDADRQRGYQWAGWTGGGQGGSFDNADANYSTVMLSLFDRIRLGWVRPRYLTPDNRGCFVVRPFLESREALILFDPKNPHDWYTLENRQCQEDRDEVLSSGLVISWVREERGYWQWWLNRSNDPEDPSIGRRLSPAVISAAAPNVPPNMLARPVVFDHTAVTKRNDPGAAFTSGETILPVGDGGPSRFHLSFRPGISGTAMLCVR